MFRTATAPAAAPTTTSARTAVRRCALAAGTLGAVAALALGAAVPAHAGPLTPSLDLVVAPSTPPSGPGSIAVAPTTPGPDPAPAPSVTLADAPPVASGHSISSVSRQSTDVAVDLGWHSTAPSMVLQVSTSLPAVQDGVMSMTSQPVAVTGTPRSSGGTGSIAASATVYDYTRAIEGLRPNTTYHVLLTVPVGPNYLPVQQLASFQTKVRHVSVQVSGVKVISDADKGLRGKGEIQFYPRIAPAANAYGPGPWGTVSKVAKLGDGDTKYWNPMLRHERTTRDSSVVVQVQGCEADAVGTDHCIIEAGDKPRQGRYLTQDWAYAQGVFALPTYRYAGTHQQQRTLQVQKTPDLRFTAKVIVTTWYE